jgi:LacI family transcriptional regulator
VKRLGYRPNAAARSLITSRTQTMGLVLSDITNPFYPFLVDALHSEFKSLGYGMLLFNAESDEIGDVDPLGHFLSHSIDGLLFVSATLDSSLGKAVAEQGLPAVFLNRHTEDATSDRVFSDNRSGAASAARLLLDLGHEKIGLISGPSNTSTAVERDAGFLNEIERRGLEVPEALRRRGPYSHRTGYDGALHLLGSEDPPTALFCGNDVIAFGALDAIEELQMSVPKDVSVIGFDDIPMSGWLRINLTTVRQPLPAMARTAVGLLVDQVENGLGDPRTEVFATELVYRGTTSIPGD